MHTALIRSGKVTEATTAALQHETKFAAQGIHSGAVYCAVVRGIAAYLQRNADAIAAFAAARSALSKCPAHRAGDLTAGTGAFPPCGVP